MRAVNPSSDLSNVESLRQQLIRYRMRNGLTQKKIADQLSITQSTLSSFERGKNSSLRRHTMLKLQALLMPANPPRGNIVALVARRIAGKNVANSETSFMESGPSPVLDGEAAGSSLDTKLNSSELTPTGDEVSASKIEACDSSSGMGRSSAPLRATLALARESMAGELGAAGILDPLQLARLCTGDLHFYCACLTQGARSGENWLRRIEAAGVRDFPAAAPDGDRFLAWAELTRLGIDRESELRDRLVGALQVFELLPCGAGGMSTGQLLYLHCAGVKIYGSQYLDQFN